MEEQAMIHHPPPNTIPADKQAVADLVMRAMEILGDEYALEWRQRQHGRVHVAIVSSSKESGNEEVAIELWASNRVSIEHANGSRRSEQYDDARLLARSIRGRLARMRAATKRDDERDAAHRERQALIKKCRDDARAQLVEALGPAIVEACVQADAYIPSGQTEPRVVVSVDVGARISGQRMTIAQAVRFAQATISAGYDLIKMAEEI